MPIFDVGTSVLALNMRGGQKWYDATVIEKLGVNVYNVQVHDLNTIWKRHANQLLAVPLRSLTPQSTDNPLAFQSPKSVTPQRQANCRVRKPPDRLMYS